MAKVTDLLLAAPQRRAGRGDREGALEIAARLRAATSMLAAALSCGDRLDSLHRIDHPPRFDSLDDLLRGIAASANSLPAPPTSWSASAKHSRCDRDRGVR